MPNRRTFLKTASHLLIGNSIPTETYTLPSHFLNFKTDADYWKAIRAAFDLNTKKAFFNCATLGPSPRIVTQKIYETMLQIDQLGEMSHDIKAVRERIAQFVGAEADEIALTKNTTEGVNIIANGLALSEDDEIIMTNHEHVGNAIPWLNHFENKELKIKVLDISGTDENILKNLQKLISIKTKIIAIPHLTCTTGRLLPIKPITQMAQSRGILTFIDGAHGVGMLKLNLHELGCDFYATCCHKWLLGTKGTGFLYVKKTSLNTLKTVFAGADTHSGWNISMDKVELLHPKNTAERFDYGTYNYASWAGVIAAMDFMDSIGKDKIEARIKELNQYLLSKLLEIDKNDLQILNPTEGVSTSGMLGFKLKNKDNNAFFHAAFTKYRLRYVAESGLNSIRVSTHIFNNFEEIDGFIDFLKAFLK